MGPPYESQAEAGRVKARSGPQILNPGLGSPYESLAGACNNPRFSRKVGLRLHLPLMTLQLRDLTRSIFYQKLRKGRPIGRGVESESQSESPRVVATNQKSESESFKLPRLRIFYYNFTRLGRAKFFSVYCFRKTPFSKFSS